MNMNQNQLKQTYWKNLGSEEIRSSQPNSTYKILKNGLISRTPRFSFWKGLMRQKSQKEPQPIFSDVSIKKYELIPCIYRDKFQAQFNSQQPDIIKNKKESCQHIKICININKNQYYLIMNQMEQTLYDKIKNGVREFKEPRDPKDTKDQKTFDQLKKQIRTLFICEFIEKMSEKLQKFHKQKIFIGGLRPIFIGVKTYHTPEYLKRYDYNIIDFSLANIQPKTLIEYYDKAYLAPEYINGIDQKADIWSFGCILYELLTHGQKLISEPNFHELSKKEQYNYVDDKLNELSYQLFKINSKIKTPLQVISILKQCLDLDPKNRPQSSTLFETAAHKINESVPPKEIQMSPNRKKFYQQKIIFDISMDIARLSNIQGNIMSVFEAIYLKNDQTLTKYHLYPLLKFASCYYLEAYYKLKEKARLYAKSDKIDKFTQVKRIQQQKKLQDIKMKAASKMIKQWEQSNEKEEKKSSQKEELEQSNKNETQEQRKKKEEQEEIKEKQREKKKNVLKQFPEIKDEIVVNPRQIFEEYFNYVKYDYCKQKNKTFYKLMASIHFYMRQIPEMEIFFDRHIKDNKKVSLRLDEKELAEKKSAEIVNHEKMQEITKRWERKLNQIFSSNETNQKIKTKQIEHKMTNYLNEILTRQP